MTQNVYRKSGIAFWAIFVWTSGTVRKKNQQRESKEENPKSDYSVAGGRTESRSTSSTGNVMH